MIVMSATLPQKLNTAAMQAALKKALLASEKQLLQAHENIVSTWNPPAKFVVRTQASTLQWILWCYTLDNRYRWTDQGTKPHIIRAKNAPMLVFKSGYRAKSKPKSLSPVIGGGKASGSWISKKVVHHPGTTARDFTGQIKKRYWPLFKKEMEGAVVRAAQASGHGR